MVPQQFCHERRGHPLAMWGGLLREDVFTFRVSRVVVSVAGGSPMSALAVGLRLGVGLDLSVGVGVGVGGHTPPRTRRERRRRVLCLCLCVFLCHVSLFLVSRPVPPPLSLPLPLELKNLIARGEREGVAAEFGHTDSALG